MSSFSIETILINTDAKNQSNSFPLPISPTFTPPGQIGTKCFFQMVDAKPFSQYPPLPLDKPTSTKNNFKASLTSRNHETYTFRRLNPNSNLATPLVHTTKSWLNYQMEPLKPNMLLPYVENMMPSSIVMEMFAIRSCSSGPTGTELPFTFAPLVRGPNIRK